MKANPSKLTYQLYLSIFEITESCDENDSLKSLIDNLVMNFELWIAAERTHLTKIVSHWGNVLYESCGKTRTHVFKSFSSLIASIRIYFWYEPIEIDIIKGIKTRIRDPNLNIDKCHKYFKKLLYSIRSSEPSDNDALSLLSQCATCNDVKQVCFYFKILQSAFQPCSMIIDYLFFFFKPKKEIIFVEALKALYKMSGNDFMENLDVLLSLINSFYCTQELFDRCYEILPDYSLIFPLLIEISVFLNDESMKKISQYLT